MCVRAPQKIPTYREDTELRFRVSSKLEPARVEAVYRSAYLTAGLFSWFTLPLIFVHGFLKDGLVRVGQTRKKHTRFSLLN